VTVGRTCVMCPAAPRGPKAKYCSDRCRKRAQRMPKPDNVVQLRPSAADPGGLGPVEASVRRELEAAGILEGYRAEGAIALAARIDLKEDLGSAMATMIVRLDELMTSLLPAPEPEPDAIDGLKARMAKRLSLVGS
jgi:hypothetical protein